jgi:hypothetical protein
MVASIIVGAMMWFGPLAVIWLDLHGAKALPSLADNCGDTAANPMPGEYPIQLPRRRPRGHTSDRSSITHPLRDEPAQPHGLQRDPTIWQAAPETKTSSTGDAPN